MTMEGEVYSGLYDDVAAVLKMLPEDTRKDIRHINDFLVESEMTMSMEHPGIVKLVGVAWSSLANLCVVLEYVDDGDLRMLLNKYQATQHPRGFDREKITTASQICKALVCLHSMSTPVIHRDVKILLTQALEAKARPV